MKQFHIAATTEQMGEQAAVAAKQLIEQAIAERGSARILISTGASQFAFFEAILKLGIDWSRVEIFHLDEYVDLPISHPASFRKYIEERFVSKIGPLRVHYVNGEDAERSIAELNEQISKAPIDVGVIGIGENAHIAFNDPPADFDCTEPFRIVALSESCKRQQVNEGWFATVDDVPKCAISASVTQIMKCKEILSVVPHTVKAKAICDTLAGTQTTPDIPASILKTHPAWSLFLDWNAASQLSLRV